MIGERLILLKAWQIRVYTNSTEFSCVCADGEDLSHGARSVAIGATVPRPRAGLRLILARESPALHLVNVHFPKAGFELSEP
jgi:hypothetical protein